METPSATLYVLIKTYQSMKAFALFFSTLPSHHWNYFKWQNRIVTCIDTDIYIYINYYIYVYDVIISSSLDGQKECEWLCRNILKYTHKYMIYIYGGFQK